MSMEVRESRKCLEDISGTLRFKYSMLLLRNDDNEFFSARSSDPHPASTVQLCELEDVRRIAPLPFCPPEVIVAPETLANMDDTYVKRPDLLRLATANDSQAYLLEEVRVCEIIKRHPHPNLAEYRGCVLSEGRIIGICFKRYRETLMGKVNPGHLNKAMLIEAPERAAVREEATRYLPNIRAGLQHLHSLGIIHNDLNPMNVMIDENDNPVIIDFDSCRVVGAPLQDVKRTYGWYNQDVGVSSESNDTEALKEIQVFLAGSSPGDLIFSI
ncbi:Serine/threonine-protein kinase [Colletotrichum higginsianum IMI 349063]|uniref:Serine/threonine-protein kinase n=1 Tax=Colletotrichum higginsianum (strain IMI 349063) TaxID=759273 RepID=A0A1B7Y5S9_COLHI|nr:Serine/threonine-protein kinase [Colletotrichum higginsianum IMI 349063]OBR07336.1 Serine/threonine-protein kinase [Colletotrichum higginsianum IMI 349063]